MDSERYQLTDKGLNQLIGHMRVQERNFLPVPQNWLDGPSLAPTLVERGYIIKNDDTEQERLTDIALTAYGLKFFATLEDMMEGSQPSPSGIVERPDLLLWLGEKKMVHTVNSIRVSDTNWVG